MEAADDPDPDPDGWPVRPAAAFYGLWPRLSAADEAEDDAPAHASSAAPADG